MIAFLRKNLTGLIPKHNSNNLYFSFYSKSLSTWWKKSHADTNHEFSSIMVRLHNFDREFASRVASKLPRVKDPANSAKIMSFLRRNGFSDPQLEKMVKHAPRFISIRLEQRIKPKINFFQEMGLSSDDIAKMISGHPGILELSLKNNIIPSLSLLKRLLGCVDKAVRVIRIAPRVLPTNLENTMLRNVEFLEGCGVPMDRIRIILSSFPSAFLLKPEVVRKSAEKAEEMGITASSNTFIYAVPTIASMSSETWELKLQAFRSLGFSDSDIMLMFRKAPQVFAVSMEKIKKIVELLLDTGKYTISSIVVYPKSLQSSIEKRYMPRLQILRILESRNLIKDWPTLTTVSWLSNDRFFKKYNIPIQQS